MRHPSALHRSEYPHISPPFLSCPCLQQSCLQQSAWQKKHTFDKRISNVQRTPIIAHEKNVTLLSQHIVTVATNVTAPARTTSTPQHNSTPKRTPIANTYIKMHEHVLRSDVASSCHSARRETRPNNCALSNNERHRNCKKHIHTHSTRDQYATR